MASEYIYLAVSQERFPFSLFLFCYQILEAGDIQSLKAVISKVTQQALSRADGSYFWAGSVANTDRQRPCL